MPGSDDLAYQPTQETHSFQAQGKNMKSLLFFFTTVIGLLAVFATFFLILNFFNIISLSKIYPNQFGFLPHLKQATQTTQSKHFTSSPTPAFTPVDTSIITTKDSAGKINQYKTYALPAPRFFAEDGNWQADGVFAGYGNNTIMIISSKNTLVFNFNTKTVFEQITISNLQGSSGAALGFTPYSDFNAFIKNVSFGKYVQVYYSQNQTASNKTVTKVDYIPSYKF
jgi:hypothetical protein